MGPTVSTRKPPRSNERRTSSGTDALGLDPGVLGGSGSMPPTSHRGAGDGRVRIEAEVERPDQGHEIDLRLAMTTPGAGERDEGAVAMHGDRHQRVRRLLARRELVGVAGLEREATAPIVGDDPGGRLEDAGAEAAVQTLDQGDAPPVGIGGDECDGVALDVIRSVGGTWRRSPSGMPVEPVETASDDVAEGGDVAVVQERRRRGSSSPRGRRGDDRDRRRRPSGCERASRRPGRSGRGRSRDARRRRAPRATRIPGSRAA